MADLMIPKATTIVSAAMESAGATIQSDMLDYINTASGQTLAGFLYLLAIVGALFAFASGGNYRWGRYLLIGPALFFFLTNIRTQSDGTEWAFGNREFSQEAITKVLRGVDSPSNGGGTSVSLVYHFWNVFMSEVVQELIKLLNLTDTDSQFNFIQKVERYMQSWNFSSIKDRELRALIKLTLSSQCKDYFHHLRVSFTPAAISAEKEASRKLVGTLRDKTVLIAQEEGTGDILNADLHAWLKERNMLGQSYSCQTLWERLISEVKIDVEKSVKKTMTDSTSPEQNIGMIEQTYVEKMSTYIGKREGQLTDEYLTQDAAAIYALDWAVGRSLMLEIWDQNPYVQEQTIGVESDFYQMGEETYIPGKTSAFNENVSKSIQQFNITDKYAQRGEFVTAALSLPYFQGVGLLLLSASYPFFAMMVVMPGRALSFFTWMGLWAWLKLWDLGFAVVMLLDNMLYAMFPRGPNVSAEEMKNAGVVWSKIMEVDPNYSQAVYYNLIGTCLFAVPLVTGVFVKGGGGELVNLINQGWSAYSMRIAGGAASFSRSFQAQGFMGDLQKQIIKNQEKAADDYATANVAEFNKIQELSKWVTAIGVKIENQPANDGLKVLKMKYEAQIEALQNKLKTGEAVARLKKAAEDENTYGKYAANRAVASRYYSHDLAASRNEYYAAQANALLAKDYYDTTKEASATAEGLANFAVGIAKSVTGGAGK
jgi:hypothetical protein